MFADDNNRELKLLASSDHILEESIWSTGILNTLEKTYSDWASYLETSTSQKQGLFPSVLKVTAGNNQQKQTPTEPGVSHYSPKKGDFLQRKSNVNSETEAWLHDLDIPTDISTPGECATAVYPPALKLAGELNTEAKPTLLLNLDETHVIEHELYTG